MNNRIYPAIILGFFALLLTALPLANAVAETLLRPQQVIQQVSDTLQQKLQDRQFSQDLYK